LDPVALGLGFEVLVFIHLRQGDLEALAAFDEVLAAITKLSRPSASGVSISGRIERARFSNCSSRVSRRWCRGQLASKVN
jgi:hypothetical protein